MSALDDSADSLDSEGVTEKDIPKLLRLSDSVLATFLLKENRVYMKRHGRPIQCRECDRLVTRPEDLVRYFEQSLHRKCFLLMYDRVQRTNHLTKQCRGYYDRVLKIVTQKLADESGGFKL